MPLVQRPLRAVAAGRRFFSPPLRCPSLPPMLISKRPRQAPWTPYEQLTDREREVLHLAAEGLSDRKIAALLSVSPRTIETHCTNSMRKLELRNRAQLIRYAVKRNLIE
jgi:DNA-binding NarL/FixJ family response regulator